MRILYTLKCAAKYGRTVVAFYSEQARDERANALLFQGYTVVLATVRH